MTETQDAVTTTAPPEPLLIDTATVALLLGRSRRTIERWIALGDFPPRVLPRRQGRRPLFVRSQLVAWIEAGCPKK